ncbi:MAG: BON domain-containing protein [Gemmatales bacterium]|nr:BON domain-containing protein [Gemmatales bacterium]MDW7995739.1 BON domain-containing protein [Gemmatales bacterium]
MVSTGTGVGTGVVKKALWKTGLPSLRELKVEEDEHQVVVTGSVPSYYCKQVAQQTVLAAAGGRKVVLNISVNPPRTSTQTPNEP